MLECNYIQSMQATVHVNECMTNILCFPAAAFKWQLFQYLLSQ